MNPHWQPTLENELVRLVPLVESDFEELYAVASDPSIWQQHPNPDRYQREVFSTYFKGAIESGGALKILNHLQNKTIGCTRYYDADLAASKVYIGYTFFARDHWGSSYNPAAKELMISHAFLLVENVFFHIGSQNIRSQIAIGRLGAIKVDEVEVAYFGEKKLLNYEYLIRKEDWRLVQNKPLEQAD
jgi:N-acetyltransferase